MAPQATPEKEAEAGMLGRHDVGGLPASDSEPSFKYDNAVDTPGKHWEKCVHASMVLLCNKGHLVIDELRRATENLPQNIYDNCSYYGKWARGLTAVMLEKGILTEEDVRKHILLDNEVSSETPKFKVGDAVTIKGEDFRTFWLRPHLRTPGYVHGCSGVISDCVGLASTPNEAAYFYLRNAETKKPAKQFVYTVMLKQKDIWKMYEGNVDDEVGLEVFEPWLKPAGSESELPKLKKAKLANLEPEKQGHGHSHEHHDHDHEHEERERVEQKAVDDEGPSSFDEQFAIGYLEAMYANDIFSRAELSAALEAAAASGGNIANGAKVVARAWKDPDFAKRLREDANKAVNETLGLEASNPHVQTQLVCCFNEPKLHHVLVCTLCSCYPGGLLGSSPAWYKSRAYRSRVVVEPRKVLSEFGTDIPDDVAIRVHDSTADCRYMVVPLPPDGFENMSEEELWKYVTRDRLIGVKR